MDNATSRNGDLVYLCIHHWWHLVERNLYNVKASSMTDTNSGNREWVCKCGSRIVTNKDTQKSAYMNGMIIEKFDSPLCNHCTINESKPILMMRI